MDCYDMSGDGVLDLLVGRQDGTLDIYSLGDDGAEQGKLSQRFTYVSEIISKALKSGNCSRELWSGFLN